MAKLLLDLFCGGGGASAGYSRAGFEVVGVDIEPQPNYPFPFLQLDVLTLGPSFLSDFDAVHASPPCQAFTVYGNNHRRVKRSEHPDLIEATRRLLREAGWPYVIENVPRAPLFRPVQLCGTSFGLEVRRHRLFESSLRLEAPSCDHSRFTERKYPGSSNRPNGRTVCNVGEWRVPLAVQQAAMEIDWLPLPELSQAIPPAYTEHIGRQLLEAIA